jgi:hypothetical protein
MQQGLSARYDYADYIYVPYHKEIKEINLPNCNIESIDQLQHEAFQIELGKLIHDNNREYVPCPQFKEPELPQLLIASFDTHLWNKFNPENKIETYTPIWDDK